MSTSLFRVKSMNILAYPEKLDMDIINPPRGVFISPRVGAGESKPFRGFGELFWPLKILPREGKFNGA